VETIGGQDFCDASGKAPSHEARIIANEHFSARGALGIEVIRDGLGNNLDIIKGKISGNNTSPTIRSKSNGGQRNFLLDDFSAESGGVRL
jgi:hypothetical protein